VSYTQPTPEEIARRRADLAPFDTWNERAFCQVVAWMGMPKTYLDLGSGDGAMVNVARKLGIDAYGVDVINGPEDHFITHDLREPLNLQRRFDLITCLEVAEHLDLDNHRVLVATIKRHLRLMPNMDDPSGFVLFSAAPPGQMGEHHVGCRPAREWRAMFHEAGLSYREDYTRQLCHLIGFVAGPAAHWLAGNLQVFDTGLL
jgi:methyltransferase family protein